MYGQMNVPISEAHWDLTRMNILYFSTFLFIWRYKWNDYYLLRYFNGIMPRLPHNFCPKAKYLVEILLLKGLLRYQTKHFVALSWGPFKTLQFAISQTRYLIKQNILSHHDNIWNFFPYTAESRKTTKQLCNLLK